MKNLPIGAVLKLYFCFGTFLSIWCCFEIRHLADILFDVGLAGFVFEVGLWEQGLRKKKKDKNLKERGEAGVSGSKCLRGV